MRTQRLFTRLAVTAATAVSLVGTTGGLALAHPGTSPHEGHTDGTSSRCRAERGDVADAEKHLEHAHRTGKPKKVDKAEDELSRQQKQASRWCSAAKSVAAATARADAALAGWTALATDPALAGLPGELQTALAAAATAAQAEIQALQPQIPGASSRDLAHLVNRLRSLDPTALAAALDDLGVAVAASSADPADLLAGVLDALARFDPTAHQPRLHALAGAVEDAAVAVAAATPPVPTS